jgi:hypothetical protein
MPEKEVNSPVNTRNTASKVRGNIRGFRRDSLRRLLMSVVEPRERRERAQADNNVSYRRDVVPTVWLAVPPQQHPRSGDEAEAGADELAHAQIEDRAQPKPNGGAEHGPVKTDHQHKEDRDGPHHRHRVWHQRNPPKTPQYSEQDPAKAAPASSSDSVAASKIFLIVFSL